MDIIAVQDKMIELGLCIRAIPRTHTFVCEVRHKFRHPDGVVYYDEHRKRDMLLVVHQNDYGGKFMISQAAPGVRFNNRLYFDSIEDALNSMAEA